MKENRFQSFKKALDGTSDKWGHVYNLTHEETRDEKRFPYGTLIESDQRPYMWTYSVMGMN